MAAIMKTDDFLNLSLKEEFRNVKANFIEHALAKCRYNQSETARQLGISRGTLRTYLKDYFGDKYIK